ncbi:DUF5937 family protein [Kitasatospora sp. NPDC051853]|uniref:ArsR/SmtB family transcription factor n=1 Tax=Kitasatospora sp. NPDC051853 TaxID=3364058 RepID=UPI0037A54377
MLTLEFTAQDLARTRFALSPLWEVVAAARLLLHPEPGQQVHRPWLERVRPLLAGAGPDWTLLADLVPAPPRTIPVFVAPPPTTLVPDLTVELAVLRATAPDRLRAGLTGPRAPRSAAIDALLADPARGLAELAEQVTGFWETAVAPYWPRMRSLLEGDVLYRARLLAEGGADRLLNDLDPSVGWDTDTLSVGHRHHRGAPSLGGRGLLLVPSVFAWPRVFSVTAAGWQPTLRYPPRGVAALWERPREVPRALAALIGGSRARLLAELDAPASTTDLARRTGLTAGGVSQHLGILRDAGLVDAHRTGRYVLYLRTAAAESLLGAHTNSLGGSGS